LKKLLLIRNISILAGLAASCTPNAVTLGAACTETAQCQGGTFCISGRCSRSCVDNASCDSDSFCGIDFTCQPRTGTGSPITITNVTGDAGVGTVRAGMVITGSGFDTSTTAQLLTTSMPPSTDDLPIASVTSETSLTVGIPSSVAARVTSPTVAAAFVLRLSSPARGSATREVSLLQGERGPTGSVVGLPDCTANQILRRNAAGTAWECADDTLGSLACADGRVPVRSGGTWVCSAAAVAPLTRTINIPLTSFYPVLGTQWDLYPGGQGLNLNRDSGTEATKVAAAIPLPEGATLTRVACFVFENVSPTGMVVEVKRVSYQNGANNQLTESCGSTPRDNPNPFFASVVDLTNSVVCDATERIVHTDAEGIANNFYLVIDSDGTTNTTPLLYGCSATYQESAL
jgi:hypothetical protein